MYCKVFETYVKVGNFLIVSQPMGSDIVGWLIDVKDLDDICVDEVSLEDGNYFFLDNSADRKKECGLIEIWKEVDSSQRGFEQLNLQDAYKLKGIQELVQLRKAMWFGQFNASNLAFVFPPEEITSGLLPPLNGMKNLFFGRYFEWHGQYGHLEHFKSFLTNFGYAYCVFTSLSHIRREVDKMLFRSGTSQGNRAYVKTYMPADYWNYISLFFQNHANIFAYEKVQMKLFAKVSAFNLTQKKGTTDNSIGISRRK